MRRYERYKDTKVEWLGQIPHHWEIKKLFWISDITSGTTPEANYDKYYNNGEYHWVNTGDLNDSNLTGTSKFVTRIALVDYSALKIVKPNTVVIAMYGATIGKLSILKIEAVANQGCCCISTNESKLNYNYLFYYLLSNREHIINMSYGAGQPNISQDIIKNFNLSYPPITEQQQIADYLDQQTVKINVFIQKQNKLIELLQEKKKSLINHVVTKGLNPDVQMKNSDIEWLGQIPESWQVKKLKHVGTAIIGLTYSPDDIVDDTTNGILVLRSSNVQQGILSFEDNVYVNMDVPKDLLVQENDILICSRNGSRALIGKNAKIDKFTVGCTFGAFMTVFRSNHNNFVYYILNSSLFDFQSSRFLTSTINQLTTGNLNNFEFPLPSSEEQQHIAEYLDKQTAKIDTLINKAKSMIELLTEHKQSLINHVVTGKIKVVE